ncbi:MAG TPA: LamG domain-containing protein [Polyangiaceae bacterium]|nr:LamG domain-containing protein [Polyangiaceae bacterium]
MLRRRIVLLLFSSAAVVAACHDFTGLFADAGTDSGGTDLDGGVEARCDGLPYAQMVLCAGAVAYYHLDESDGTFRSVVSGAPEGTAKGSMGGVTAWPVGAIYGADSGATTFDGGYIDFGDGDLLQSLGDGRPFSLELWFRPRLYPDGGFPDQMLLSKEHNANDDTTRQGFGLGIFWIDKDRWLSFVRYPGYPNNANALATGALVLEVTEKDMFRHVVVTTSDGNTLTLYVNGGNGPGRLQSRLSPGSRVSTNDRLLLGADESGGRPLFSRLDELAIYPRALSAREVYDHFRTGGSRRCEPFPDGGDGGSLCYGPDVVGTCTPDGRQLVDRACLAMCGVLATGDGCCEDDAGSRSCP